MVKSYVALYRTHDMLLRKRQFEGMVQNLTKSVESVIVFVG